MLTLKERAKEFAQNFEVVSRDIDCGDCDTCTKCKEYKRFVVIATKQREIDIERAICYLQSRSEYSPSDSFIKNKLRKILCL